MSKPTGKLEFAYQSIARLEQKLSECRAERDALAADNKRLRQALGLWLADYDEVASNPDFEPFPHVAERVDKTRAALAGSKVGE